MSLKTRLKAGRLWADGRVTIDIYEPAGPNGGPSFMALVRGDTNGYAVTCGPDSVWRCPCQSFVTCSHLAACWIGLELTLLEDGRWSEWHEVWEPTVAARLAADAADNEEALR